MIIAFQTDESMCRSSPQGFFSPLPQLDKSYEHDTVALKDNAGSYGQTVNSSRYCFQKQCLEGRAEKVKEIIQTINEKHSIAAKSYKL